MKLSAELLNVRTGASVWAGSVTKTSDVGTRDVSSVVTAMSLATQDGVSQLVIDMEQRLRKSTVAAGGSGSAAPGIKPIAIPRHDSQARNYTGKAEHLA